MATIRPFDLPPASSISNIDAFVTDDGISVQKVTIQQIGATAAPFASQAQAEAGVVTDVYMNPKLTADAIAAQAVTQAALSSNAGALMVGTDSGQTVQERLDAQDPRKFTMGLYAAPPLEDGLVLAVYTFTGAVTFPADFTGSRAFAIDLPTSETVYDILRSGAGSDFADAEIVGTLTYAASGAFAFATVDGDPIAFDAGDAIGFRGPATADATATCSVTFEGDRT